MIPTGIQHGTVTVVRRGVHYEVTTLRGEGAYSDGRRPDKVEFVDDITADLARRDFTVNAMAIDPVDGHLIDPFDGRKDLEAQVLRAVGEPEDRFAEDGLRVLRAARFSATLGCSIDPKTERAMGSARSIDTFRRVSAERVRDEWLKAMRADKPSVAFEAMRRTSILGVTCPELLESVGCAQNKWHAYDVWGHAMACLDACRPEPILRVAALLHDVAKPRTRAFSDKTEDYTFYEHERVGAEMAEPLLARLRFSNDERGADRLAHPEPPHLLPGRLDRRRRAPLDPPHHPRAGARPLRAGLRRRPRQGEGRLGRHRQHPAPADAGRGRARQGGGVLGEGPGARRQRADERPRHPAREASSARSWRTWWRR